MEYIYMASNNVQIRDFTRIDAIKSLQSEKLWDIIVIGGGATGLGIAVDAASRGYKTLLVEKHDFAKGTSSKSTKLVHGGVRYLANGDFKLVYAALHERGLIFQNAPHLASIQRFIIPLYHFFSAFKYFSGLTLYDWMAGDLRIGKSKLLSKKAVIRQIPTVKQKGLIGGIAYFDGQFDDARFAINLAQTANEHGATVLNYTNVIQITKDKNGKATGVIFTDSESQKTYTAEAKTIINATGIFVDDILKLDMPDHQNLVRPSQGTHIVLDAHFLGGSDALMVPKTSDGRVLFAVPWHGKVLLGTTDTPLNEHEIEPRPLAEEISFILNTAGSYLNPAPSHTHIRSIFAGLRPLAAPRDNQETKEISRDHKLFTSQSGLISITGGKWTTYRKMAEEAVNLAIQVGQLTPQTCQTKHLRIHGYDTQKRDDHWQIYGADIHHIEALIKENPSFAEKIHPEFDFCIAEVIWACKNEMALKVEDFLARRIRMLLLNAKASLQAAPLVAKTMAQQLGKDEQWIKKELADYHQLVQNYIL
ncbi:FAD-dependent oxidoreductase [Sphingobacterium sp. LRF_L2]|uniref:glycerol-3-phosphate dehydrogenase/oxidase n=1 Tax=Sphingobacterium sp. LRF_L2 TaxID=3369421 RepID=UPI003F60A7E8